MDEGDFGGARGSRALPVGGAAVSEPVQVAPAPSPMRPRRRLRRPPEGTGRLVTGVTLLVLAAAWAALSWASAVRQVDVDQFHRDLATHRVIAAELVEGVRFEEPGPGVPAWDAVTWDVLGTGDDGSGSGSPGADTALAYRTVDAVGALRLVRPGETPVSGQQLLDEARSTVPPVTGDRVGRPSVPSGPIALLVVLGTFLAVVGGPPPRWGTRWFWFWVLYLAAPVGLVAFVSLELLTRRRLPRDGRAPSRRQSGWRGVGLGLLLGFALALSLDGLRALLGADVVP